MPYQSGSNIPPLLFIFNFTLPWLFAVLTLIGLACIAVRQQRQIDRHERIFQWLTDVDQFELDEVVEQ